MTSPAPRPPSPRPRPVSNHLGPPRAQSWQTHGGGTAALGAILLVAATWVEYFVLGPGTSVVVFGVFLGLFAAAIVLFAIAAVELARRGIVGDSVGGRIALSVYGLSWLISQLAYLAYKYFLPISVANYWLVVISTVFLALSFVCGVISAIVIARRRIAHGPARWSLFVALGLTALGGVAINSTDSLLVLTLAETVSALGQLFAALTYYFAPRS